MSADAPEAAALNSDWLADYLRQIFNSSSFSGPVEEFIEEKCAISDLEDPAENKLEYTDVHNEFKDLVESLILANLVDVDITLEQMVAAIERDAANGDAQLGSVTTQLISFGDFAAFKRMMTDKFMELKRMYEIHYGNGAPVETAEVTAAVQAAGQVVAQPAPPPAPPQPTNTVHSPPPAVGTRASRITAILENASKAKVDQAEKSAMVRVALAESSGRLKGFQNSRIVA